MNYIPTIMNIDHVKGQVDKRQNEQELTLTEKSKIRADTILAIKVRTLISTHIRSTK